MTDRAAVDGLVLTPLRTEYELARKAASDAFYGNVEDRSGPLFSINNRFLVARSGMGPSATSRFLHSFLDRCTPEWILMAGFCAGAHRAAETGTCLHARRVVPHPDLDISEAVSSSEKLHATVPQSGNAVTGDLLTVPKPITRRKEKRRLGAEWGVVGMDTETAVAASIALERQVPFLGVRVVLDNVYDDLSAMQDLFYDREEPGLHDVFLHLLQNPKSLASFPGLVRNYHRASTRFTAFFHNLFDGSDDFIK